MEEDDREREQDHEGETTGLVPVEEERQEDGRVLRGGAALRGKQLRPYAKQAAAAKVKSVIALQRRVALAIREETDDLGDLVKIMVKIAKGEPMPGNQVPSVIQQRAAAEYLLDRVIGRPTAPVEIRDDGTKGERVRIDALPADILDALESALAGGRGLPSQADASGPRAASASAHILERARVIDVPAVGEVAPEGLSFRDGHKRTVRHEVPAVASAVDPSALAPDPAALGRGRAVRLERSGNIYGAWYDPDARAVTVTFRPPPATHASHANTPMQRWTYENVDVAQIEAWEDAPSAGAWFARELRGGNGESGAKARHPRRRIADAPAAT